MSILMFLAAAKSERLQKDLDFIFTLLSGSPSGEGSSKEKGKSASEEVLERATGRKTDRDRSREAWDAALRAAFKPKVLGDIDEWDFYDPVYSLLKKRLKTREAADFYIDDVLSFISEHLDHFVLLAMGSSGGIKFLKPYASIRGVRKNDVNYTALQKTGTRFVGNVLGMVPGKPFVYNVEIKQGDGMASATYEFDTSDARLRLRRGPYHMEVSSEGSAQWKEPNRRMASREIYVFIEGAEKAQTTAKMVPEQIEKLLSNAVKHWLDVEYSKDQKSSDTYMKKFLTEIEMLHKEVAEAEGARREKLENRLENLENRYKKEYLELSKVLDVAKPGEEEPTDALYELGKKFGPTKHQVKKHPITPDKPYWYKDVGENAELTEGVARSIKEDLKKSLKLFADKEEHFKGPLTYKILVPIMFEVLEGGVDDWRDRFMHAVQKYIRDNNIYTPVDEPLRGDLKIIREGLKNLRASVRSGLDLKNAEDAIRGAGVEGFDKVLKDNGFKKVKDLVTPMSFHSRDVSDFAEEVEDALIQDPKYRSLLKNLSKSRMREYMRGIHKVGADSEEDLKEIHEDLKKLWATPLSNLGRLRAAYNGAVTLLKDKEITKEQYDDQIVKPTYGWFRDLMAGTGGMKRAPDVLDRISTVFGSGDDELIRTLWRMYLVGIWHEDNMTDKMDWFKRFLETAPSIIVEKLSDMKDKIKKEIARHFTTEELPSAEKGERRRRRVKRPLDVHVPEKPEMERILKEKDRKRYEKLLSLFA